MNLGVAVETFESIKDKIVSSLAKLFGVLERLITLRQVPSRRRLQDSVALEVIIATDDDKAITDTVTSETFSSSLETNLESEGVVATVTEVSEPVVEVMATDTVTNSNDENDDGMTFTTILVIGGISVATLAILAICVNAVMRKRVAAIGPKRIDMIHESSEQKIEMEPSAKRYVSEGSSGFLGIDAAVE